MRKLFASPARVFVCLALLFGALFIVLTPPWMIADEAAHYVRTYTVSRGDLYIGSVAPYPCPEAHIQIMQEFYYKFQKNLGVKVPWAFIGDALTVPRSPSSKTIDTGVNSYIYFPLPYVASALALHVTEGLDLSPLAGMYAGRFANLLVWTALIALGLTIMPVLRYELMFVALLPMSLFQGMGITADSLVNALSFLLFSCVTGVLTGSSGKRVWRFTTLGVASLAALSVACCKQLYALPYVLTLFAEDRDKRATRLILGTLMLSALASGIWLSVNGSPAIEGVPANVDQAKAELVQNPQLILSLIRDTISLQYAELWRMLIGTIGFPLPSWLYLGYSGAFAALLLFGCEARIANSVWVRLVSLLCVVVTVCAFPVLMYIIWTHDGTVVEGIQGRYFLPVVPLLLLLCAKTPQSRWNPLTFLPADFYPALLCAVMCCGLAATCFSLYGYFFA